MRSNAAPTHRRRRHLPERRCPQRLSAYVLIEAHDECQVSDCRCLSEASMALLTPPALQPRPTQEVNRTLTTHGIILNNAEQQRETSHTNPWELPKTDLDRGELHFAKEMAALVAPPYPQVEHLDVAPRASPDGEEVATARIDFRLGEHLKSRIDAPPAGRGVWSTTAAMRCSPSPGAPASHCWPTSGRERCSSAHGPGESAVQR